MQTHPIYIYTYMSYFVSLSTSAPVSNEVNCLDCYADTAVPQIVAASL